MAIIVNNFNYARFVGRAIDSALGQTYDAVNVIVVDDGSTDGSREVIASYGAAIVPVFKENGGQASAFNAGFAQCAEELVIFLDADDMLSPDVGGRVVAAFENDRSLTKVQYPLEVIDAEDRRSGIVNPAPYLPRRSGDLRREELSFPFDLTWTATSGNAFASPSLQRIFPVPEQDYPLLADFYVVHLTPLLGRVAWLDGVGGYYRVHGGNRFAQLHTKLDLDHVRRRIVFAARTQSHLESLADELGLGSRVLSVSDQAGRLVSLKLEPARHPIAGETVLGLLVAGIRASRRRFDVSWPLKALFMLWFVAVAVAPSSFVRVLSEWFFFADRRVVVTRLLARLHVN